MKYNYEIEPFALDWIYDFYKNVITKYEHVYSLDDYYQFTDSAIDETSLIETDSKKIISHRDPSKSNTKKFKEWAKLGYLVASTEKWHYAYTIENDTIIVHDACHQQNNESYNSINKRALYENLMLSISKIVKQELNKMRVQRKG